MLFIKSIEAEDLAVVEHLLKNGANTEWEVKRQGEDEWGRYSVSDELDMLAYAKAKKPPMSFSFFIDIFLERSD